MLGQLHHEPASVHSELNADNVSNNYSCLQRVIFGKMSFTGAIIEDTSSVCDKLFKSGEE